MAARVSADALLTEHFRYTPLSLIDDIINTVNAIVYRALQAIESGLLNTPPAALGYAPAKPDPKAHKNGGSSGAGKDGASADPDGAEAARAEIETGVHQLETLLEATVDRTFDKFELYTLRHLLSVDAELEPWIRLAHYEDLNLPTPPTAATPASILALRQQLAASRDLNLALEDANARATRLLSDVHSLLTPTSPDAPSSAPSAGALSFLTPHVVPAKAGEPKAAGGKGKSSPAAAPLATAAGFATSQLPALQALLAELRPRARALAAVAADPPAAGGGDADERRAYIEGTSRRVVRELVGAVEGEEEGAGVGRDVTMEDVRALEKMVGSGTLGAGGDSKEGVEGTGS